MSEATADQLAGSPPCRASHQGTKRTKLLDSITDYLAGSKPSAGASHITKVQAMCGYWAFGHHVWRGDLRNEFAIMNLPKDQKFALYDTAVVFLHVERLKFGLYDNIDIFSLENVYAAVVAHKSMGSRPAPAESSRNEAGRDHMLADNTTVAAEPTKHAPAKTGFQVAEIERRIRAATMANLPTLSSRTDRCADGEYQ